MRKPDHFLFFVERTEGSIAFFSAAEWRHAVKVLRIGPDAPFMATDGAGRLLTCQGLSADYTDGSAMITVTAVTERPKPEISLFVGLPERDAFERIIEEATPLGVTRIIPMASARCQDSWWAPKWEKLAERFRNVMISAAKQSRNPWLPELLKPITFMQALPLLTPAVILADEQGAINPEWPDLPQSKLSCVVGPPGGFSDEELTKLTEKSAVRVNLGCHRLRTELAATVLAVVSSRHYLVR